MNNHEVRLIDTLCSDLFKARKEAAENKICVTCGKPALHFKDDASRREWKISLMCQVCQDEFFEGNFPEEDDEDE